MYYILQWVSVQEAHQCHHYHLGLARNANYGAARWFYCMRNSTVWLHLWAHNLSR